MSNGTSHESPTYAEIYRQIAIILPEGGEFEKQKLEVYKILEGVDYETLSEVPDLRLVAIQVAPSEDLSRILVDLRRARDVVETAEQNRVLRPSWVVDDPLYRHQWALWRIGAEPAWQHALATLNLGAPGIIVAIVDSGVHTGHPDLAGHLWTDGAGHHGRNLLTNTFDVSDTDGHGTLLAGTVGAISNNATGIAAAEWPIRLMAVKFLDIRNPPTALSGALAIWWAVTHGAQVITAAWGVGIPSPILQVAIGLANVLGVVFVAAAGNDGLDNDALPTYPASFGGPPYNLPNVVSVMASERPDYTAIAALDTRDDKAWFSNYGRTRVHLAAPGVGILSTDTYSGTPQWRAYSGTSPACAHVAYAAALLKALNPTWTPNEIREHLVASVDRSPWLACVAQGRLSLDRAVRGPFTFTSPVPGDQWAAGTPTAITWTNSYVTGRPTTSVTIQISQNGGAYTTIAAAKPNSSTCTVTAPGPVAAAKLRIRSDQGPGLYADSGVFRVQ
jgi:subtilisin family serine protease